MSQTAAAFSAFRASVGVARLPPEKLIANEGQRIQMTEADGLKVWADGSQAPVATASSPAPLLTSANLKDCMLWVVREDDVVWAPEKGPFGKKLESGVIKHTNLTGGAAAYCGGELLVLEDELIVVVNGCSGRYGPRNSTEMDEVAKAFAQSGYGVWSMGYDEEAARPLPFIGVRPKWIV